MKRIIRKHNRRGFTLVETILAVFILFVVSTMLVNGFIAAIAYSYQTSIYGKSGTKNADICMQDVANWSNLGKSDRELEAIDYEASKKTALTFQLRGTLHKQIEGLNVAYERNADLSATVPLELNYADGRFAPAQEDDQLSDNRTIVKYYPEYCFDPSREEDTKGEIIVVRKKEGSTYTYHWTVADEKTDFTKWKVQIN